MMGILFRTGDRELVTGETENDSEILYLYLRKIHKSTTPRFRFMDLKIFYSALCGRNDWREEGSVKNDR